MNQLPFTAQEELYHGMYIDPGSHTIRRRSRRSGSASGVSPAPPEKTYLPSQPRIDLHDPDIGRYLQSEFVTDDLNQLSPHLWLVAKQDSTHISSLTHQIVRGRQIVVTEKPELHLVWINDRVFIKPIPKYAMSYAFWEYFLTGNDSPVPDLARQNIIGAALGFLRSYSYLVHHKSDFIRGQEYGLIPKGVSHTHFVRFISTFREIGDAEISPRYRFGELRLNPLNFWSKIYLHKMSYHKIYGQYGAYFARFYGPLLFLFAIFSVLLAAMQVVLSVPPADQDAASWIAFALTSRGFSIFTIVFVVLSALLLLTVWSLLIFRELLFAVRDLRRKWKSKSSESNEEK